MAIDLTGLSSTPTTGTRGRVDNARTSGQSDKQDKASTAAPGQTETVKLSGEAQSLKKLEEQVAQLPDVDADRVAHVKRALEEGSFNIDPERIAAKLVDLEERLFG